MPIKVHFFERLTRTGGAHGRAEAAQHGVGIEQRRVSGRVRAQLIEIGDVLDQAPHPINLGAVRDLEVGPLAEIVGVGLLHHRSERVLGFPSGVAPQSIDAEDHASIPAVEMRRQPLDER